MDRPRLEQGMPHFLRRAPLETSFPTQEKKAILSAGTKPATS